MVETLFFGGLIGFGGTVAIDLWVLALNRVFGQPMANWALIGRWVWHLRKGRLYHDDINAAAAFAQELRLGWAFHYGVGAAYGVIFVAIVGGAWLAAPGFLPAWIFGMVTVGAAWFVLQPGLGLGWLASKAERPWKVRGMNLVTHTVFALGMWGTALLLGALAPAG